MDPELEEDGVHLIRHRVLAGVPAIRDVAIGRSRDQMRNDFALRLCELLYLTLVDERKGTEQQGLAADGDFGELGSKAARREEGGKLGARSQTQLVLCPGRSGW